MGRQPALKPGSVPPNQGIPSIQIYHTMRLLHRHRRQIPGRHQAAPKQGLLVFMIQLKDFHQQIFNGLKQCFYFRRSPNFTSADSNFGSRLFRCGSNSPG